MDKIIGQRLRSFRLAKEMSQGDLGTYFGITFQQIQKYESGKNRLSRLAPHHCGQGAGHFGRTNPRL